ncbi:MAG TPA: YqhA family protein [Roseiflexaceae bacterium]|nr:YqhA family protein [Roseiflexaceae bacterium]
MINWLIASARYLIIIAVVATLIAATALLVFGAVETIVVIAEVAVKLDFSSKTAKQLLVSFIEIVDVFLLATVLYIIAIGLYELFISDGIAVPAWLEIHTLDDLKDKLIAVVIVVLGVAFLGQFVSWDGTSNLLVSGGGAALVIASLTYFLSQKPKK